MFRKLISNVSFSPALVGQLAFYARRLKKEEATRRLGLVFTALALVVQSLVVFNPPEAANAANGNDMITGGVTTKAEILTAYDRSARFRNVMNYAGITKAELSNTSLKTINNLSKGTGAGAYKSWGFLPRFSAAQGEVKHSANGTTVYSRPNHLFNSTATQKKNGRDLRVFAGTSAKFGEFAIMLDCGNLIAPQLPSPPPPPPPPAPKPSASCDLLSAIKRSDDVYQLRAKATVKNGATISKYSFTVNDAAGKQVKKFDYQSSQSDVTTSDITLQPGKYTASVAVATTVGSKISESCKTNFTVASPGVSVIKLVNGKEHDVVGLTKDFTYTIQVKNTGQTTLRDTKLTDDAPEGIEFTKASAGTIANAKKWSHTVASLAPGASQTFTLTAKATKAVPYDKRNAKNTVCVDTPSIPGAPDDCDDATVTLPEQEIKVCDLVANKMITIKVSEFDKERHSKNPDDCVRVEVCDLKTGTIITLRKTEFDDTKHTRDLTKCDDIQVCDLETGDIITIKVKDLDESRHARDAARCQAAVAKDKKAINLSRNGVDATTHLAMASDRIQYTITATNIGDVPATADFVEHLDDITEYAAVTDFGGGNYDRESKILTWPSVTLAPGESQSRIFVVQLASTIPAGARGVTDYSSYDCIMLNTYGNSTEIKVNCPAVKGVETAVTELPTTGPTENMIFAGILFAIVTYFYARSRQLKKEVRLIRRDLNTGILQQS